MIKLVVFDWNGTLLADTDLCIAACNHKMTSFGGRPLTREQYARDFSFPTFQFYVSKGCDPEALKSHGANQCFYDSYEALARKCRTRRGAREVLGWLKDNEVQSVILSNHPSDAIIKQLDRLVLSHYNPEVLGNEDIHAAQIGHNKIHRMGTYFARTGIKPEESLIVGDSPEDIGIGKHFGMTSAAIKEGYFSTPRLKAANPDYLIGNLLEIKGIVEEINLGRGNGRHR